MTALTYNNPRDRQGDPYEVAGFAVGQAVTVLELALRAVRDGDAMARNAWLSREIDLDREPNAAQWPTSSEARLYREVLLDLDRQRLRLIALARSAAWDPNDLDGAD